MPRYIDVIAAASETATKILALRTGGQRYAVTVTTEGGKTASVTWEAPASWRDGTVTLNMPTLPPDAILTRAEADRLVAFIGHECCHVLWTDKAAWVVAVRAGARVRDWTNALEDVRIEHAEIGAGHFPALRTLLASMANHLHFEAVTGAAKSGIVIGNRIADAPYIAAILGRVANGYAIPAAGDLAGQLAPAVAPVIERALAGVRTCDNTDDVRRLAEELVALEGTIPPLAPPTQPGQPGQPGQGEPGEGQGQPGEPGEGQGQPGEPGEPGEGQGQPGEPGEPGEGQGQPGEPGEPGEGQGQPGEPGEGQGQPGKPGEGQGQPGGGGKKGDDVPGIKSDADLTDTVERIAGRAGIPDLDRYIGTARDHVLSTVKNTVERFDPFAGGRGAGAIAQKNAAERLGKLLPNNSVLHGQISRLLVSDEKRRVTHHESSGRLDRRALARMRTGATDVYSRRDDSPGIDTALLILVDGSSSMSEPATADASRMEVARTTAWHIGRAAEAANAKVAIACFHTGMARGAIVRIVKDWSAPIASRAAQLANVPAHAYTPLSPAILEGARLLCDVAASRRILMVLTDGECDFRGNTVSVACRLAAGMGVETVGVGMACASVTAAFPERYSVNVTDLSQLAAAGLGALVTMLEDANPREAD